jgi:FkbM family methyltransferase
VAVAYDLCVSRVERAARALRRPDLALRRLRSGADVIEISVGEIAGLLPDVRTILEAGALNGGDTVDLANQWPHAIVHAFEPVPEAFAEVVSRTADLPNVRRYQLALADESGPRVLHVSADAQGGYRPDSSSLLTPTGHLTEIPSVKFDEDITVDAVSLRDWAGQHGIDSIDLMWLDLQGMEIAVLRASTDVLAKTRAVVMEVSRREMYAGTPLYPDVIRWMKSQGFRPVIDRVWALFGNILFLRDRANQHHEAPIRSGA